MTADVRNRKDEWTMIAELLSGKRSRIVKMLLFFCIKASPVWLVPIVAARMIDLTSRPSSSRLAGLALLTVVALLLYLQNIPFHTLYVKNVSRVTRGIGCDLRVRLCRQLQSLSLYYHGRASIGKLHTKAIRDIEMIENVPRLLVETAFQFILGAGIAIVAIAIRAPSALLFFAVMVPVCAFLCAAFMGRIRLRVNEYRQSMEGMSTSLNDMMTMIPITRAHGLEEEQLQSVEEKISNVYDIGQMFDRIAAIFGATAWVVMGIMQTVFLTGSVYACFRGSISVGDVVMFNSFFLILSGQLTGVLNVVPQFSQARESLYSIMEVLSAPDLENNDGKLVYSDIKGRFEFCSVSFRYPGTARQAVSELSLTIEPGQSVAFVGPSGAGKSTVLSLLLGFIRPDSGRLLLDDKDIMDMDLRTYRHRVGVVTQEAVFFSGTIFENVAYGQDAASEKNVIDALHLANAAEFIEQLPEGLYARLGAGGIKLSGGQLQRLALARAIIRNPRVLILDEATSALDIESEMLVQQALEQIMKGRTTFIVAHRISTVRNADRIAILDEGRFVEIGSPDDLIGRDNFYSRAVHRMQYGTKMI
jgi:ATP-binding cassette subfamily B protein